MLSDQYYRNWQWCLQEWRVTYDRDGYDDIADELRAQMIFWRDCYRLAVWLGC